MNILHVKRQAASSCIKTGPSGPLISPKFHVEPAAESAKPTPKNISAVTGVIFVIAVFSQVLIHTVKVFVY